MDTKTLARIDVNGNTHYNFLWQGGNDCATILNLWSDEHIGDVHGTQ